MNLLVSDLDLETRENDRVNTHIYNTLIHTQLGTDREEKNTQNQFNSAESKE